MYLRAADARAVPAQTMTALHTVPISQVDFPRQLLCRESEEQPFGRTVPCLCRWLAPGFQQVRPCQSAESLGPGDSDSRRRQYRCTILGATAVWLSEEGGADAGGRYLTAGMVTAKSASTERASASPFYHRSRLSQGCWPPAVPDRPSRFVAAGLGIESLRTGAEGAKTSKRFVAADSMPRGTARPILRPLADSAGVRSNAFSRGIQSQIRVMAVYSCKKGRRVVPCGDDRSHRPGRAERRERREQAESTTE